MVKIVAKLLVSDDSYFDFFLKKRRFQKHFKILLRNEAQTVRLCGFDVMKIIENRRHPRDFEDLKQLFNSRDLEGDTTFLLKIFPKTVEPFLNPQTDRFSNMISFLFTTPKVNRSLNPQTDRFSNMISFPFRTQSESFY